MTTSRFVWHDLSTDDVEGSKRFYGELFGWAFEQSGNEPYHHVRAGDRMIGGLRKKEAGEPGPACWMGYVLVESVPAAVERATAGGGRVYVPPTTMPDVGTFAVVADPSGGVVAPWRSARPEENEEAEAVPGIGAFCRDELLSTDPAAAATFYASVFGWATETQSLGAQGEATVLTRPGVEDPRRGGPARAAGVMQAPPSVPHTFWLAYVRVADADATARRAEELGAHIAVPPRDLAGVGRFCTIADPQHAVLGFVTLPEA